MRDAHNPEEDVRLHDLRRTVGSWLAQARNSLPLIGRVLNHTNASTTQIYARLGDDPARQALEKHGQMMTAIAGEAFPISAAAALPALALSPVLVGVHLSRSTGSEEVFCISDPIEANRRKKQKKQPAAVLADPPTAAGIKKSRLAVLQRDQKIVPAVPHLAPLSAAIEHAEQLVGEAQVLAWQFNLAEGHTLVFNEDFNLSFGNAKVQWWQEFLTASAVRPHGQTAPEPGVRIQLFPDVQMRDSPR